MIPKITAVRSTGSQWPTALIAVGLLVLLAAAWRPAVPAVTGMALVALGATATTLTRFRGIPALLPVTLVHLAVYGSLYALFVGAALHAADTRFGPRLEAITIGDVIVSLVPMLVAGRLAWGAMQADRAGDA